MPVLATFLGEIQPGVLAIWAIAAVILGLTIMVARRPAVRSIPPQPAGALAIPITAGPSPQGGLSNAGVAMLLLSVTCLGAAMLVLVHNALQRPKGITLEQVAGWLLFAIAFAPGVAVRTIRAEALAMLGRTQEAEQAVEAASQAGDPAFRGGTAAAIWRCGRALQRMNRETAAGDLFKRAAEIDPHGLYGGLAASALQPGAARPINP